MDSVEKSSPCEVWTPRGAIRGGDQRRSGSPGAAMTKGDGLQSSHEMNGGDQRD